MSRLQFLVNTLFINCIISDQDDKVKTESLIPMTAPTNGTNFLKPGVSKSEVKAEDGDGEGSYCWHINTLESMWSKPRGVSIPRVMKEKLSNMKSKPVSDVKVAISCKNIVY